MRSFLIIYCFFFTLISKAQTAVDLGLSVRWADCNLGAEKPEDYGGLYGWADPTGDNPVNYDAGKRYDSIDRRELLRRRSRGYLAVAKKLNADDIMLGKEPHISSTIRDLIELDYK